MRITNTAIKYRTAIVALTLLLVVGGLFSYLTIPKESRPSIEIPNIIVTTVYPGSSPSDIESLVTQILEQEIEGIDGIDQISSTSTQGVSSIQVEFTPDVNMDKAYREVRDRVDIAKSDLPDDIEEPLVNEINISELPIMTVNLGASYSLARLKEVAEDVQDELESISGVLEANIVGGLTREVQINVDLNALKGYGLSFQDLVTAIQEEHTTIPGGDIDVDRQNYLVQVDGRFEDPMRIRDLVVQTSNGNNIYMRDVADVTFGFQDPSSYARMKVLKREVEDGEYVQVSDEKDDMQQVISLNIKKRSGENILETSDAIKSVLDEFNFPSGTQVTITGDESENVQSLVTDLENNIISGLLFVVLVLLFFLGVRNATLVGIAIPLSMFVSFIVFKAMGQSFNFIILFSLIIALGMLVDNAVVIVENIYRFKEEGYERWEAAKLATAEVGGPVVGATATTVLAFVPMLFWPGIPGKFMSYLPMTLIITLVSSLFVALVINPVITGIFVKVKGEETEGSSWRNWPRTARLLGAGAILLFGVVLAFANWETLLVLLVLVPSCYYLYTRYLHPVADRFVSEGLPRLVNRYRGFLELMLERDYSSDRALLRNTWALGTFTAGVAVCALGGLVAAAAGPIAGGILLLPGGVLVVAGLLGIFFHALESLFLGGKYSVEFGLIFGAVMLLLTVLIGLSKGFSLSIIVALMILPVLVVLAGLHGWGHRALPESAALVDGLLLFLAGFMVLGGLAGVIGSAFTDTLGPQTLGLLGPAFLLGTLGYLGRTFRRRNEPQHLFLTDNRARLLTGSFASLFTILALFVAAPTGQAFFPESDPDRVQIALEAPIGTNVEASNQIAQEAQNRIQQLLRRNPESQANIQNELVNVGVGGDAMFGGGAESENRSQITLNMVDFNAREESSSRTLRKLREQMADIPGVEIEFTQNQQGPPTGPPVNIEVSGPDFDRIVEITRETKNRLNRAVEAGRIDGLVDVTDNLNTGRPELRVSIDRERARQFGLSTAQIATTVRSAVTGTEAAKYRAGDKEYDIRVRLREEDRQNLESLQNLSIALPGGGGDEAPSQVPLVSVADLHESTSFGSITHLDLERVVTVEGDAAPGFSGPEVLGQVQQVLSEYRQNLPQGYSMEYTGGNEDMQESFGFLTTALLVGASLIFLVLIVQFNSMAAPFIIMVAVGLSLIGVLLGLIATRTPFSLFTFIGIISLAGIVVNNNIVLIDYVMQLRQRGLRKRESIVEGGATRLRPVLLTALTTVLGLVPLTFGINVDFVGLLANLDPDFALGSSNTQFWGPMGTAIISGLIFATFLTLVIVPVMYSAFDSLSLRLTTMFGGDPDEASIVTEAVGGDGLKEKAPAKAAPDEVGTGGNGHPAKTSSS